MMQVWLAFCLTCVPVVATAQPVFTDVINASVTGWSYDQAWHYGGIEVRARFAEGLGAPAFWLRSTRREARGATYGEIALFAQPSEGEESYEAIVEAWAPFPLVRSTRSLSVYVEAAFDAAVHSYAVSWQPGAVVWYFDGVVQQRVTWTPGDGSPWSVLDDEWLTLEFTTDPAHPVYLETVRVWAP